MKPVAPREHDSYTLILQYWRAIVDHRYVVLATFALGVAAAAVVGRVLPPVYRARATVLVEDETPRMVGMQGVYSEDIPQSTYCLTQTELIKSRKVLLAAAKRLGMESWEEFQGEKGEKDVVQVITEGLEVGQMGMTTLIQVAVDWPDQDRVHEIANAIVDAFQEVSVLRRRGSSESATGWIGEQTPRLAADVIAKEDRLREFQEREKILSLDGDKDIITRRLVQLSSDVTVAEKERIEFEAEIAQVDAAEDGVEAVEFLPSAAADPAVRQLDSQILALQSERFDMLRTVRFDHRDVQAIDAKIAELAARRRTQMEKVLAARRRRLGAAVAKERMLRQALAEQEQKALELNEKLIKLTGLQRDVERAKQLHDMLFERRGKLDLAASLDAVPVQIWERAVRPEHPVKPRKVMILIIGAVLGLVVGFQLALLLERIYTKLRFPEEMERLTGLTALGSIPHMTATETRTRALACHLDPRSAAAEAYRSIRTRLLLATDRKGPAVFLVTSAVGGEGKTTTALNIASALAQTGRRVLIVDADLRRSSLHQQLGIEKGRGLSTHLADGAEARDVVRDLDVPCLSVVTAGQAPETPSEMLGSAKMTDFLRWAREQFDFIVLDSPPVAAVTDATVLAPLVDGVLLVVRAQSTPRNAATHGRLLIEHARGKIVGAVLNDVSSQHGRYYGYGYGYGYGHGDYYRTPEEEAGTQGQAQDA